MWVRERGKVLVGAGRLYTVLPHNIIQISIEECVRRILGDKVAQVRIIDVLATISIS